MSLLRGTLARLVEHGPGEILMYATGRFDPVRRAARFANSFTRRRSSFDLTQTLFPQLDVEEALSSVNRDALYPDVNLPFSSVKNILGHAENTQCFAYLRNTRQKRYFHYRDHEKAEADIGQTVLMGGYDDPASQCAAIAEIQNDPKLLEIASRYLNGDPRLIMPLLWWSFPKQTSIEDRLKAKQTVLFHFDLHAYTYIYFNFYITEVDVTAGPHVVVLGSHKGKKLSHLLGSANQSDENIIRHYGQENIATICGKAGFGFIEDSFCYHKATAPTRKSRLMLQIRMS